MKFLGGIDTFHFKEGKLSVKILNYHRTATGLFPATTVYLYPRKTNGGNVREVVISPFHPASWSNIWKLELSSLDRPGLIKDVTKILSDREVNILIQESLITNYNQDFTISLIADFSYYFKTLNKMVDRKLNSEELEEYRKELQQIFGDKAEVDRFEQVKFLINNSREVIFKNNSVVTSDEDKKNLVDESTLRHYYTSGAAGYKGTKIDNKSVQISEDLLSVLDLRGFTKNTQDNEDLKSIQGTLFSDSEEKYIIARFFSHEQLVVNLEITHHNKFGAIHSFTDKISQVSNGDFNIIHCYNRIEDDQDKALWYVLIDVSKGPENVKNLIDEINKIKNPTVYDVQVVSYSESLMKKAIELGFHLEQSIEQREKETNAQKLAKENLELLREGIKDKRTILETLVKHKTEIEVNVNREIKFIKMLFGGLISISIIVILGIFIMFKWDIIEPTMTLIYSIISLLMFGYSFFRGVEIQLPRNDEKTRNKIRDKWIKKLDYDLDGSNSVDSRINVIEKEIEKYTSVENKDLEETQSKLLES